MKLYYVGKAFTTRKSRSFYSAPRIVNLSIIQSGPFSLGAGVWVNKVTWVTEKKQPVSMVEAHLIPAHLGKSKTPPAHCQWAGAPWRHTLGWPPSEQPMLLPEPPSLPLFILPSVSLGENPNSRLLFLPSFKSTQVGERLTTGPLGSLPWFHVC